MFPQKGGRKRNKNKLKLKALGCFLSLDPGTLNNHILLVASVRWFQIITSKMTCFTKHSFLTKSCSEFEVRATKKPIGFCTISFYAKTWIAGWLILGAPQVDTPIFHGKNPWLWEDPGNDFAPQDVEPFHRVGKCHSLVECPCRREAWRPPESSVRTCLSTSIGATSKNTSKKKHLLKKNNKDIEQLLDVIYLNMICYMTTPTPAPVWWICCYENHDFFPIPNLDVVDIPNGIVFQKPCCFGILKKQQFGPRSESTFFWSKTHRFLAKVAEKKWSTPWSWIHFRQQSSGSIKML